MKENTIYSDFDLSMIPHPMTGDLEPKVNQEAIKRSIRNLFHLDRFDIPFNATHKSSLKKYLFEQNNHITRSSLRADMIWLVKKLEPRIALKDIVIEASEDGKGFDITVTYKIASLNIEDNYNFIVERAR